MAYQVRYRIEYRRLSNSLTTIDILDSAGSGSITNLNPTDDPLHISFGGDVNNIYQPTLGSGATIGVYAEPLTLLGLFTADPLKFMVKIYNGVSGSTLVWQGFVNTKIYSEDYSSSIPVPIQIQCNDGMAILDTIYYKNGVTYYLGTQTIGTVLNTIIGKLGLTFNNVYTSNDITTSTANRNLFNNIQVKNENYLDESSVAMTCREVLNSIIGGLPLIMRFIGANIYIYNPYCLANTSNGRCYSLPGFTETTVLVGGVIDISTPADNIKWFVTGMQLDTVGMVNEVDVEYNPYNLTDIGYDFNDSKNFNAAGSFSHITTAPNDYWRNSSVSFKDWAQSAGSHFIGLKNQDTDNPTYVTVLDPSTDVITYTIPNSPVFGDGDLQMKVTAETYCQTRLNSFNNNTYGENIYGTGNGTTVNAYSIVCNVTIGGTTIPFLLACIQDGVSHSQYAADNNKSIVNDVWNTSDQLITVPNFNAGNLTFSFFCSGVDDTHIVPAGSAQWRRMLLKNLKIEFQTLNGKTIDNSVIQTKGNVTLNSAYKTDAIKIPTTSGSGNCGLSKGSYLNLNGLPTNALSLYIGGTAYTSEQMLLQSFLSQYKLPRLKLSGVLNAKDYLYSSIPLKLIKDSTYLTTQAFYIVSGDYVDIDEAIQVDMIELPNTRENI